MINAQETKRLLKEFSWSCYEFWGNELKTDDDAKVWPKVIMDLECVTHDPFSPKGDLLDADAKTEFIRELKLGGITMSKVYGYCRVALANEVEMAEQVFLIDDYCINKGLFLCKCFCDNGVSGTTLDREALNRMLDVLQSGDLVVVKDIARLSRNASQCMALIEQIEGVGATLNIIN